MLSMVLLLQPRSPDKQVGFCESQGLSGPIVLGVSMLVGVVVDGCSCGCVGDWGRKQAGLAPALFSWDRFLMEASDYGPSAWLWSGFAHSHMNLSSLVVPMVCTGLSFRASSS